MQNEVSNPKALKSFHQHLHTDGSISGASLDTTDIQTYAKIFSYWWRILH